MKDVIEDRLIEAPRFSGRWQELANRVLEGHRLTESEGLAILRSGDEELLDVLAAAYRIRYRWHGNRVHLNFLMNAKSGRCAEDCAYCSQAGTATSEIPRYSMLDSDEIFAVRRRPRSGRQPRIASSSPAALQLQPSWTASLTSSRVSRRHSACTFARRWACSPRSRRPG